MSWRTAIPEAELEIYRRAGFGHRDTPGSRPAILVIDVQYRTTGTTRAPIEEAQQEYPTACGDIGWAAVDQMVGVLDVARAKGIPVIYPHVAPKRSFDAGRLAEKVPTIMGVDAKGYEFVAEVAPREGDILVPKRHPSAFFGTSLASYLVDLGVDTVVVCGCTTSGCVRSTVTDAFSYNYKVVIPEGCVYDRGRTSHEVNLFDMDQKYASVMETPAVISWLESL
jgi:maleamate amidohydrolase